MSPEKQRWALVPGQNLACSLLLSGTLYCPQGLSDLQHGLHDTPSAPETLQVKLMEGRQAREPESGFQVASDCRSGEAGRHPAGR